MINDISVNSGGPIDGTTQVNNIAISDGEHDYSSGDWYGGVDYSDGYVIVSDTTSANLLGRTTGGDTGMVIPDKPTFWKSSDLTDDSLIGLINKLPGSTGGHTTVSGAKASISGTYVILNDQKPIVSGYSFELVTLPYEPPSAGRVIFPVLSGAGTEGTLNPNKFDLDSVYWNVADIEGVNTESYFNTIANANYRITFTQNGDSAVYTATGLGLEEGSELSRSFFMGPANSVVLVTASDANFVANQLVTISFELI